jgi:hypothetical protein
MRMTPGRCLTSEIAIAKTGSRESGAGSREAES